MSSGPPPPPSCPLCALGCLLKCVSLPLDRADSEGGPVQPAVSASPQRRRSQRGRRISQGATTLTLRRVDEAGEVREKGERQGEAGRILDGREGARSLARSLFPYSPLYPPCARPPQPLPQTRPPCPPPRALSRPSSPRSTLTHHLSPRRPPSRMAPPRLPRPTRTLPVPPTSCPTCVHIP